MKTPTRKRKSPSANKLVMVDERYLRELKKPSAKRLIAAARKFVARDWSRDLPTEWCGYSKEQRQFVLTVRAYERSLSRRKAAR